MAIKRSSIGWTDFSGGDANFIIGCTPASEGCANCYARTLIESRQGRPFSEVRLYPEKLKRLAKTRFSPGGDAYRRGPGSRPMVFLVDLGDWCHPAVPDEFRTSAFDLLLARDDVDWQWLTKRPEVMAGFVSGYCERRGLAQLPAHFWMMVTAENQRRYDERVPWVLRTPATVRGLSIEPMLGPIVPKAGLEAVARVGKPGSRRVIWVTRPTLDWVILGAESGNARRPFDLDWARRVRDECRATGVPFFYKQGSHRFPGRLDVLDGERIKEYPG